PIWRHFSAPSLPLGGQIRPLLEKHCSLIVGHPQFGFNARDQSPDVFVGSMGRILEKRGLWNLWSRWGNNKLKRNWRSIGLLIRICFPEDLLNE
ncbi:hypothetical protein E2320_005812, partial [Naja naja]